MWKEFEEFMDRGNVVEMAVGIIMGSATTAVVNSLVENIMSPIIGVFLGGVDFGGLSINVGDAQIQYGAFIQALINFFVIAFVLFLMIRFFNRIANKKTDKKEEDSGPSEIDILKEIRDQLAKEQS